MSKSSALASPYSLPAEAYLALANNKTGVEKQSLMMLAAGRYIYDGQWRQGSEILSQIETLTESLSNEKNLLLAKIDLIREQPRAAIAKLAKISAIQNMPIYYQVQFHEMLALAYLATGHAVESVIERIKLDNLLQDEAYKANNRRALWLSLTKLPLPDLDSMNAESSNDRVLNGWVALSQISRKQYASATNMLADIKAWQQEYPNHPANSILPQPLDSVLQKLFAKPKHIALLLPITGPLSGPGNAIKDGFMAASNQGAATDVRVYNTAEGQVANIYQTAVADGADFIVGPLSKADVAIVNAMQHPVPTLLLNDLSDASHDNAYQFGLSPTNQARLVALKARKNGFKSALVITPTGAWGDEVAGAFQSQFSVVGGQVVDTLHYAPQDDLSVAVRDFLHVSEKEAREKQARHTSLDNGYVAPKRRQDFDMIFLVAYPTKARQIMPMLKYYFAENVPVYATSNVYGGSENTMADRDLNNIIFCDMPFVFSHQMGNRNWPEQYNSYSRLYALGMDSFSLSTQLNQLLLFPALGVNDNSGVLYLNEKQQISQILLFGQFKQGRAVPRSEFTSA